MRETEYSEQSDKSVNTFVILSVAEGSKPIKIPPKLVEFLF